MRGLDRHSLVNMPPAKNHTETSGGQRLTALDRLSLTPFFPVFVLGRYSPAVLFVLQRLLGTFRAALLGRPLCDLPARISLRRRSRSCPDRHATEEQHLRRTFRCLRNETAPGRCTVTTGNER